MRRRRTAHRFGEKRRTTDVLTDEKVDFSGLMLSSDVLEGLKSAGFERPSPIQLKAIPLGRCGLDLIAQAKSGTGKTCVFSVIALESINLLVTSIQVLVLAPTREIAVQIKDVISAIGQHMKGLQTHVFIGGMPLVQDKNCLELCHIAIGTPGRIKHLIESKVLQTTSVRLFILDEADKLLEDNFQDQVNWIFSTLPSSKQTLALSATYPEHLAEKLKNYMKEPTFVRLNASDPALEGIRHFHCVVPFHSLPHKVFEEKIQSLLLLLSKLSFHQCLIFSNYQIRARNLSETLEKNGWPSTYISGSQAQNERLSAMAKLKEFRCRILISTDLTSRGIDAERVNLVINMDMPHDSETYLHRVGRAGRFGSYGIAVNFVSEGKEVTSLHEIEAHCGVTITPLPDDVSKLLSEEVLVGSQKCVDTIEVRSLSTLEGADSETENKPEAAISNDIVQNKKNLEKREVVDNHGVGPSETESESRGKVGYGQTDGISEADNTVLEHNVLDKCSDTEHCVETENRTNGVGKIRQCQEENMSCDRNAGIDSKKKEIEPSIGVEQGSAVGQNETEYEENESALKNAKPDSDIIPESVINHAKMKVGNQATLFTGNGFAFEDDFEREKPTDNKCTRVREDRRNEIFFHNLDANGVPMSAELDEADVDCKICTSEESGSSSSEDSNDYVVPVTCSEFDNVLEMYLHANVGRWPNDEKQQLDSESQPKCPNEGAGYANKHAGFANELAACSKEQANYGNEHDSDEAMFYGATPDDVMAYMAELPAEWTKIWYRVYNKQTKFIVKYTKFCRDNI